ILSVCNLSYTLNQVFTILVFVISLLIPFIYLNDKKLFNNKLSNNKLSKINYKYIFMGMPPLIILQIISTFISKKLNIEVDIINLIKIDISNITNIILFILFIAVLPAIFEELFFRHAMLSKLKKFGSINAIVITAVMFGLMHLNLTQGIFAVFTGILFGYIAIKCNSVKETMILHLLNNLFAALSFIFMSYNLVIGLVILALVYIVITAIGVGILNINLYKDHTKFYITDKNTKVGMYLFKDYIVVLTLIIYILMTVYMTMILG
ncbi:MAG: type II CAAX endopeptidase family protein, partial [Clostridia bacterium]